MTSGTAAGRHAIFLSGPIGAGKTSLGRALAAALGGSFVDSDDLRDHRLRWIDEVLTNARRLVAAGLAALDSRPVLVIAMPLRRRDWRYLEAGFRASGVISHCVTLAASLDSILDPARGRHFSEGERARIAAMIEEGYAARDFSSAIVPTDRQGFAETVEMLAATCRSLVRPPVPA